MKILPEFQHCLDHCKSIYDFISMCLEVIYNRMPHYNQIIFVTFINEDKGPLEKLRSATESEFNSLRNLPDQIKYIKAVAGEACKNVECAFFQHVVFYSMLQGINKALYLKKDSSFRIWGPLDETASNRFRIYIRPKATYLDSFVADAGRKRNIDYNYLLSSLDRFIFVDTKQLCLQPGENVPKGILLDPSEGRWRENIIRIGISPLCHDINFNFSKRYRIGDKQLFSVSYPKKINHNEYVDKVKKIIRKASEMKCNMVVLPEYTCSKKIKDSIPGIIQSFNDKGDFVPDIFIAGTNWTDNDENVLCIFDRFGNEIANYYKHVPFDNIIEEEHERDDGEKEKEEVEWIEYLTHNSDENKFLCLPNIGYIMPIVCRDALVIDGPAYVFSKLFSPILIAIPAWSTSINSFDRLCSTITDTFTSYVVADACSATYNKKNPDYIVSKGYIVQKSETIVGGCKTDIKREPTCNMSNCNDGCLFVMDYDFNFIPGKNEGDDPLKNPEITPINFLTL